MTKPKAPKVSHSITHSGTVRLEVTGAWRPTLAQMHELVQAAIDAGAGLAAKVEIDDAYTRYLTSRYSPQYEPSKRFGAHIAIPAGPEAG